MYSKVEIFGGCEANYLYVKDTKDSQEKINDIVGLGLSSPSWSEGSILLADYNNSITGTPLKINNGVVVAYRIQRIDVKTGLMSHVVETKKPIVEDYVVNHNRQYKYYIFPVIKLDDGTKTLGSPIVTDTITPDWDVCTIIGLIEVGKNEYIIDKDNIWRFQMNVTQNPYQLNLDKTFTDGFDRFPKRAQGLKRYVTSGLESIIGTIECSSDKIDTGIEEIERWEEFCYSSNLKLFNDSRGRILPIDISAVSSQYMENVIDSPIVTNISFTQLADINDITVYSVYGEVGE